MARVHSGVRVQRPCVGHPPSAFPPFSARGHEGLNDPMHTDRVVLCIYIYTFGIVTQISHNRRVLRLVKTQSVSRTIGYYIIGYRGRINAIPTLCKSDRHGTDSRTAVFVKRKTAKCNIIHNWYHYRMCFFLCTSMC